MNVPLFPRALAKEVPPVQHHAASEGEKCGRPEAPGWKVALLHETTTLAFRYYCLRCNLEAVAGQVRSLS